LLPKELFSKEKVIIVLSKEHKKSKPQKSKGKRKPPKLSYC